MEADTDMLRPDASHLIEDSGNPIITFSTDGRILSWNQAAERLLGWRRQEIIGRPASVVDAVADDGNGNGSRHGGQDMRSRIAQVVQSGTPIYNWATTWRHASGGVVMILTTLSPILDADGRVALVMSVAADMSDLKREEQDTLRRQRAEAVLQEREMLAQELHDNLSQNLSYVQMQVAAVRELLSQGNVEAADVLLQRLAVVTADTQTDVREQIRSLFARTEQQDLVSAIRSHVQDFCRNNPIQVDVDAPQNADGIKLETEAEVQFLRIVQEALHNVRKHAHAGHVKITLSMQKDSICGMIEDDGRGFDPAQLGRDNKQFGLRIIRQRAEAVGGCLDIDSSPGNGTRITIRMPYRHARIASMSSSA